jgi:hypothetical protein
MVTTSSPMPKSKVAESGVLRACLDLLGYSRIWHERRNTLPVLVDDGRGGKRPVKVAEPGTADILATPQAHNHQGKHSCFDECCPDPWILWIECKSDVGKQKPEQIEFQRRAEEAGHYYLLVRDVDTLRDWLKEHGV